MRKEELEQYRSIVAEIDEIRERLNQNTVHGIVTGSDREFPYVKHSFYVSGVMETERTKQDMILLRKLEVQKRRIDEFIHNIPDSEIRRIFKYRYIDGSVRPSWQWIAFKIKKHDESYPRRKHNKFLRKN